MPYKIVYWDDVSGTQQERFSTPEEDAQRDQDLAGAAQPALPEAIPMLNLSLVLIEDGHLAAVEQKLTEMPGEKGQRARAYWAKALTARRDNEFVSELWPDLYSTEAEFDDAWRRAAAMNP